MLYAGHVTMLNFSFVDSTLLRWCWWPDLPSFSHHARMRLPASVPLTAPLSLSPSLSPCSPSPQMKCRGRQRAKDLMSARPRISSPKANTVGGWALCRSTSARRLGTHLKDTGHCCPAHAGQTHSDGLMSKSGSSPQFLLHTRCQP